MQQESFEAMKQAISSAPILKIVDLEKPFEIEIDASSIAIGAVLNQEGSLVDFESKKLSPRQQNCPIHEQGLYAIVNALKV